MLNAAANAPMPAVANSVGSSRLYATAGITPVTSVGTAAMTKPK